MAGTLGRDIPGAGGGRSRRTVVVIVGVACLVGTVLLRLHAVDGRRTAGSGAASAGGAATAAPAAPTASGPTVPGAPGHFERSEEGAVAAAAAFVTSGQTLVELDPLAVEKAVREMAAGDTADDQVAAARTSLAGLRSALRDGSGPLVYRQAVLAARVDRFDPAEATVAIWNVGVLARVGVAVPQANWATSTFDLVWEREGWRIRTETVSPGPAPVLDDSVAPTTAQQLVGALAGFRSVSAGPRIPVSGS